MRYFKALLLVAVCLIPIATAADFDADDLPAASTWYLHVDLAEMRASAAGGGLYEWLDAEVFKEISKETGINLHEEAERFTAYSAAGSGFVLVAEGSFTQTTRDKIMAIAAGAESFEQKAVRGLTYFFVKGDEEHSEDGSNDVEVDGLGDEAWFSFDVDNRLIIAAREEQLTELLANGGRITGDRSHDGALFVLTAERNLIQGGMNTGEVGGDGFDSNILRNTRQVAFLIADVAGNLAVEAQLVTTEPKVANSMASIVRGLVALAAFDDDMEPEMAELLRGTRIDVDDDRLKISVALSPDAVRSVLDDV